MWILNIWYHLFSQHLNVMNKIENLNTILLSLNTINIILEKIILYQHNFRKNKCKWWLVVGGDECWLTLVVTDSGSCGHCEYIITSGDGSWQ